MQLRDAIRTLIKEVAGEDLRKIVREILLEELMAEESPRSTAAKKAAATRKANRESHNQNIKTPKIPRLAKQFGIVVGQKYKGKENYTKIKGRLIEIAALDESHIIPKVLESDSKVPQAKKLSYRILLERYERVE